MRFVHFAGDLSGCEQAVRRAGELGGAECAGSERRALDSLRQLHADAQRALAAGDHRRVVFCMDRCLDYSPSCVKLGLFSLIIAHLYFLTS